jgi:hypothetical protein
LPTASLPLLFDAAALGALRWPLPPGTEALRLERGKVILSREASPSRTGPAAHR